MTKPAHKVILTIDVEDWFSVRNMKEVFPFEKWDQQELRVGVGVEFILQELKKRGIKATFFILGWIAQKAPELVKKIQEDGHEIASHGHSHRPLDTLTPQEFQKDLVESLDWLERVTQVRPRGFRAPSFSIDKNTFWAIDILRKAGLSYDSSIYPIDHPDYGIPGFSQDIQDLEGITEVPMRNLKIFNVNIPMAGGGYFRIWPYFFTKWALRKMLTRSYAIMYFHPWEFDPRQPRVKLPFFSAFRHYVGLKRNRQKFIRLLDDFQFQTMGELVSQAKVQK